MKKKGTYEYRKCPCGKRAWATHSNGKCTKCITPSELIDLVYPDGKEKEADSE